MLADTFGMDRVSLVTGAWAYLTSVFWIFMVHYRDLLRRAEKVQ